MPYCALHSAVHFLEAGGPLHSSLDYLCSLESKQDLLSNVFYCQMQQTFITDEETRSTVPVGDIQKLLHL